MKQEDKELLLKDLCARLPYGVYCKIDGIEEPKKLTRIEVDEKNGHLLNFGIDEATQLPIQVYLSEVRPYLRPMLSIIKEETFSTNSFLRHTHVKIKNNVASLIVEGSPQEIDFYNSRHADYRGMIECKLAIKAPEGMYKFE